jgi:ubiquinone/menaquinone biosynthesis C-methylase UbiE
LAFRGRTDYLIACASAGWGNSMGLYKDRILPAMIDRAMRNAMLDPFRQRIAGAAEGCVLEIGIGSGRNLPLYASHAERILGLDPSPQLLARARDRASADARVKLLTGSAEQIPLADRSIDTIVMTFVACSIPEVATALSEMRRVLKPTGRLLFVEHGRAPDARVAHWQDRITPLWRKIQGGCHLNRKMDDLIANAGFRMDHLETRFLPGPKILTFVYEGAARPR